MMMMRGIIGQSVSNNNNNNMMLANPKKKKKKLYSHKHSLSLFDVMSTKDCKKKKRKQLTEIERNGKTNLSIGLCCVQEFWLQGDGMDVVVVKYFVKLRCNRHEVSVLHKLNKL